MLSSPCACISSLSHVPRSQWVHILYIKRERHLGVRLAFRCSTITSLPLCYKTVPSTMGSVQGLKVL